ncbi:hypothetical protein QBC99_002505 [Beijerinckia sp. GAS462]|nr:hypothetical protein [Beijerinckia sp. GAS462]SEC45298.1 hypothetical protein SAMN05443249_2724 [Beijerinckia sp. 28-YEA-48]
MDKPTFEAPAIIPTGTTDLCVSWSLGSEKGSFLIPADVDFLGMSDAAKVEYWFKATGRKATTKTLKD